MIRTRSWTIAILLLLMYAGWGSAFLAIDVVNRDLPALTGAAVRFLGAAVILGSTLTIARVGGALVPTVRAVPRLALESILIVTLAAGGVVLAQDLGAPSWLAALLIATVPVWTVVLRWISRTAIPIGTAIGTAIGLVGTGVLVWNAGLSTTGLIPIAFGLAAALGWSVGAFLTSGRLGNANPLVTITQQMFIGGLGLAVLALIFERGAWNSIAWSWDAAIALSWLMVPSSVIALYCFFRVVALSSETVASTYAFANPIVATLLSALFLGQWPDARSAVAVPLVVLGVALIILSDTSAFARRRSRHMPERGT